MLRTAGKLLRKLSKSKSGNATLIVALGMPALIGGTGLAVDTAQWYMWKRELQYAVDQAAVAGAWARTKSDMEDSYIARARQEFGRNIATTEEFSTTPQVSLQNFAGGTQNSVVVTASATKGLPFSSFLTGDDTTVSAFAQASFEEGATFTSCLIAIDEHASGAITIGGSSLFTAGCGMAALSDAAEAISVNGNPDVAAGWLLAAGGIDDWFDTHTNDTVLEYLDGLTDPFDGLTPPSPASSQVPRNFTCPTGVSTTTADVTVTVETTYTYFKGSNSNNWSAHSISPPPSQGGTVNSGPTNQSVPNGTVAGTSISSSSTATKISGNGRNAIWEVKETTTTTTNANVMTNVAGTQASLQPGTYPDMRITCDTVFSPGVYVIDGGSFEVHAQYDVTGSGVMFVLKNGAGIVINGGSNINLTAMTVSELVAQGVSQENAEKLAGMLVFEDPDSEGDTGNKINGNADTVLNGTIYLPNSGMVFSGTASVTSQCLMIAAKTITLQGNVEMTTFCPAGSTEDTTVTSSASRVRLVS